METRAQSVKTGAHMFNYIQSSRQEYFTINLGTQSRVINLLDCHLYAFIKTSPLDNIKTKNQSLRSPLVEKHL